MSVHTSDAAQIIAVIESATAQIDLSLQESCNDIQYFLSIVQAAADNLEWVNACLAEETNGDEQHARLPRRRALLREAEEDIRRSLVEMQFYDRLSQRISGVRELLVTAQAAVESPDAVHDDVWSELKRRTESLYCAKHRDALTAALPGKSALSYDSDELGIELF